MKSIHSKSVECVNAKYEEKQSNNTYQEDAWQKCNFCDFKLASKTNCEHI